MARTRLETDPARRALMRRIGRERTAPEQIVARVLRSLGAAYRRNVAGLPGSPDFANRRRRWAVFVNGCYWHRHTGCRLATVPRRNREFWLAKFADNRRRDARKIRALRRLGFRVAVVWQCETENPERLAARLRRFLQRSSPPRSSSSHSMRGLLRRS